MRLIIHAPNVHQGGGRALLVALLKALEGPCILMLDARLDHGLALPARATVTRVPPTVRGRLAAEIELRKQARPSDCVLCFANLPPLFKLRAKAYLYLQNRYLLRVAGTEGFPARARLRIAAERVWLRSRLANVDAILVQTTTVQREVAEQLGQHALLWPFVSDLAMSFSTSTSSPAARKQTGKFLYVASGEPHKNHLRLIEAWKLLAADALRPELLLTLDPVAFPGLVRCVNEAREVHGLTVQNLGPLAQEDLQRLYRAVDGLVFPSTMESFGLPLLEARAANLPIIASESDYVRDVADPQESFDPESALSIARAVKRFMSNREERPPMPSAQDFLRWLHAAHQ